MSKRFSFRQAFFVAHLWLGLGSGIIITILCLTGFLLAFHPPVEQWLNRELMKRPISGQPIAPELLVETVFKDGSDKFTAIEVPADADGSWKFRQGRDNFYVDPYTGDNLGQGYRLFEDGYRVVFRLHRWLLLDDSIGRPITGAATVIFLLVSVSGLVLWFDKCRKNYSRGLTFRKGVGWKRLNYDAHLVLGIYTLLPLVIMGASGLFWSYREPFKTVAYRVLDGSAAPASPVRQEKPKGPPPELVTALPYQEIIDTVAGELPYRGAFTIRFPEKGKDVIVVTKTPVATFWQVPARDELELDMTTAKVVKRTLYADKTTAEKFLSVIKPIHVGTVWGNFSLVIYLLASLLGVTLPLTGTIMWWNRIRAQRRSKQALDRRKFRETQAE